MRILLCLILFALTAEARAADLDLDIANPAIVKLKQAMATRAEKIAEYKDFGYIGEGRDGLLAIRTLEGLKLIDKKTVRDLLDAENDDRGALYRELANANKLKDSEAAKVIAAAAKKRRAEEAGGRWVQRPSDGAWALARDVKE
ncbi:MAG: DUF1318 domain-containing protein [Planctomycetes bacterium]|nr:DUF1318 domain-containing protein [Planctomycetota bacterium]